jgi:ABC-type nickel/cobalt efflux system permease component RcnA
MLGLDHWLSGLGGGSVVLALLLAVLLGLRHATDPDHLTAVATLIAGDRDGGARRARVLGLAWGAGHALTLFGFGVPVVLAGRALPEGVQRAAEVAIGVVIVLLGVRLLVRRRRGVFHVHPHTHGGVRHAHPHAHAAAHEPGRAGAHGHEHAERLGRTPQAAFGIGLVHGAGGSAGASVLLIGAASGRGGGVAALALFAAATAMSMALASTAFGSVLARGRRVDRLIPALGTGSLVFGAWYALAALAALPSPF